MYDYAFRKAAAKNEMLEEELKRVDLGFGRRKYGSKGRFGFMEIYLWIFGL